MILVRSIPRRPCKPLFPEWHTLLQLVDRVLAGGERVAAMRGGDGDDDRRLADLHAPGPVVDGDAAELVLRRELGRDLGHQPFGHALVRLVVEVLHVAVARAIARRAGERRDRARARVAYLVDSLVEREGLVAEAERPAG